MLPARAAPHSGLRHAYCGIRTDLHYRHEAFCSGLRAIGLQVTSAMHWQPQSSDLLVIWNRYMERHDCAERFEKAGGRVLVAENGYLGKDWNRGCWYALSEGNHNGAGRWTVGGPERWRKYGMPLAPWRRDGKHVLVLPARGIGPPGVAQPGGFNTQDAWIEATVAAVEKLTDRPIVVRRHPGSFMAEKPLAEDLRDAWCAVTWGSGAAIKALFDGVPVFHGMPNWIGAPAALPFGADIEHPFLGDRLPMFERLMWAQWTGDEIASGEAFRSLLFQC